uniref:Ribonuclease H-like domain-containing protein n=1 Tax=Tanacetum cinerariifolium TaxID=118510 RepID=A0A699ICW6_TANCI|nr:ribonuclease H-like domain-containing protein [Tanacetum cinerariifolium]
MEKPKFVRPSAPIIKDWESYIDDDCKIRPSIEQNKPSHAKINFVKSDKNTRKSVIKQHTYKQAKNLGKRNSVFKNEGKATGEREVRPVWNNAQSVNNENFSNNLTYPHHRRNFVPMAVITNSGKVPVNTAKQISLRGATSTSTGRYINTAATRPTVNGAKPSSNVFHKSHSPVRRTFNQITAPKNNDLKETMNTAKDETSGIHKSFITGIENQLNHRIKIIRCDNKTEFKNSEMNQFCQMKRIKREFSVARTPQQNVVAKRNNKTLIEAARTMLADLLLPTIFWAEAVNTACYVQNKVLVIKPQNKIPYELLIGRSPNIDFMKPFGCPVTILNTLDHLGRGPEWIFDINSQTKFMNYEPVTARNQTNDDACIEINVNVRKTEQEKASDHEFILLPFMHSISPLSSNTQSTDDKDDDEVPCKGDEGVSKGSEIDNQERTNSGVQDVTIVGRNINTANTKLILVV